ncbi:hypothetical protein JCM10207_000332 [Rhodosporidiobolus poonsookiae]
MATPAPPHPAPTAFHSLLGLPSSSPLLTQFLAALSPSPPPEPTCKPYSDIVFLNYPALGISLSFAPLPPFQPCSTTTKDEVLTAAKEGQLRLTGVDLYNHTTSAPPTKSGRTKEAEYAPFAGYPVLLPSPSTSADQDADKPAPLLDPSTTGASLLSSSLGEPTRKGGGSSATPGMGIWTEWTFSLPEEGEEGEKKKVGVMVEWASSGLKAWEEGGEARWRVCSVFEAE